MSIEEWTRIRDAAMRKAEAEPDFAVKTFHEQMAKLANAEIVRQVKEKMDAE